MNKESPVFETKFEQISKIIFTQSNDMKILVIAQKIVATIVNSCFTQSFNFNILCNSIFSDNTELILK